MNSLMQLMLVWMGLSLVCHQALLIPLDLVLPGTLDRQDLQESQDVMAFQVRLVVQERQEWQVDEA